MCMPAKCGHVWSCVVMHDAFTGINKMRVLHPTPCSRFENADFIFNSKGN